VEAQLFFAAAESAFERACAAVPARDLWLTLAGRCVRLRVAGAALFAVIEPVFHHLRRAPSAAPDLALLLWDESESGVAPPPRPWAVASEGPMGRVAGYGGERFDALIDVGGGQVSMLDHARGVGFLWVRAAGALPPWDRVHPMRQLLAGWASRLGLQFVHAGAVGFGSAGVLLVGPGGSGKSTTVLACLGAGARTVGDDCLLIEDGRPPVAHSLYGTMRLFESHQRRFPGLMPESDWVGPGAGGLPKLTVNVAVRRPHSMLASLPLASIVIPRVVAGGATRLVRETGGAALFAIAPNTLKQFDPTSRASFERMARLCKALPCWRLELGADIGAIPRELRGAIAASTGAAAAAG
jgi:hypothetical protein